MVSYYCGTIRLLSIIHYKEVCNNEGRLDCTLPYGSVGSYFNFHAWSVKAANEAPSLSTPLHQCTPVTFHVLSYMASSYSSFGKGPNEANVILCAFAIFHFGHGISLYSHVSWFLPLSPRIHPCARLMTFLLILFELWFRPWRLPFKSAFKGRWL